MSNKTINNSRNQNQSKTRTMVFIAVLVAQGMVLGFIESMIPVPFIVPGAKLGLANIVTLTAIYFLNFKEATAVVLLRVFLSAITFGSLSSFMYSLSGGILSLLAMAFMLKFFKDKFSLMSISIVGALAHNIGQLFVAAIVINNYLIMGYLPALMVAAIPTGLFVGLVAKNLIRYLESNQFANRL